MTASALFPLAHDQMPILEAIHEWMKKENEAGGITRQEAVSMVPPLFLDVRPHHKVLDMCAAPGSKTVQLLEMLHRGPEPATGYVIANDADFKRCNLLTHQTKRLCSPSIVITNHDGQAFPLVHDATGKAFRFDRILCDVPCSGDGTLRKSPDIWTKWGPGNGNGLHALQLQIALHACRLLEVGGLLVYSTCTFNPIEDEAVVAEIVRRCKGSIEIVDVSGQLPNLKRRVPLLGASSPPAATAAAASLLLICELLSSRAPARCCRMPGIKRWKVKDRYRYYDSWADAKARRGFKLDRSMFWDDASDAMPLERCMRFLPHHQDTGGFFVTLLRKVAEVPHDIVFRSESTRDDKPAPRTAGSKPQQPSAAATEAAEQEQAEVKPEEQQQEEEEEPKPFDGCADAGVKAEEEAEADQQEEEEEEEKPEVINGDEAEEEEEDGEEDKPSAKAEPDAEGLDAGKKRGGLTAHQMKGRAFNGIDPIYFLDDSEIFSNIKSFYGLDTTKVPVEGRVFTRNLPESGAPKRLYLVNESVRDLMTADFVQGQRLRILAAGVKVFERQEFRDEVIQGAASCPYRLTQEGLYAVLPALGKQIVRLSPDEMLRLLNERSIPIKGWHQGDIVAEKQNKVPIQEASTLEDLMATNPGCSVCVLRDEDAPMLGYQSMPEFRASLENVALVAAAPPALACWKGRSSLNVLVTKHDGSALLGRMVDRYHDRGLHAKAEAALNMAPWKRGGAAAAAGKDEAGAAAPQMDEAAAADGAIAE